MGKSLTFEKLGACCFRIALKKIELSDRSTTRSRALVKGKTTPANLARTTVVEFFNTIGRGRSVTTSGVQSRHSSYQCDRPSSVVRNFPAQTSGGRSCYEVAVPLPTKHAGRCTAESRNRQIMRKSVSQHPGKPAFDVQRPTGPHEVDPPRRRNICPALRDRAQRHYELAKKSLEDIAQAEDLE